MCNVNVVKHMSVPGPHNVNNINLGLPGPWGTGDGGGGTGEGLVGDLGVKYSPVSGVS